MRKKLLYGWMVGFFVVLLTGVCGTAVSVAEAAGTDSAVKKDYSKIGFDLMSNETIGLLKIGLADRDVLNIVGEPENKSEAQVWHSDGWEHQTWYYPSKGIQFNLVRKEGRMANNPEKIQTVERIIIKSPCALKSTRGIGIGSTTKEVQVAYANELNPEYDKDGLRLVAGTAYGGIIFRLDSGVVASIFIGAAAE